MADFHRATASHRLHSKWLLADAGSRIFETAETFHRLNSSKMLEPDAGPVLHSKGPLASLTWLKAECTRLRDLTRDLALRQYLKDRYRAAGAAVPGR